MLAALSCAACCCCCPAAGPAGHADPAVGCNKPGPGSSRGGNVTARLPLLSPLLPPGPPWLAAAARSICSSSRTASGRACRCGGWGCGCDGLATAAAAAATAATTAPTRASVEGGPGPPALSCASAAAPSAVGNQAKGQCPSQSEWTISRGPSELGGAPAVRRAARRAPRRTAHRAPLWPARSSTRRFGAAPGSSHATASCHKESPGCVNTRFVGGLWLVPWSQHVCLP